MDKNLVPTSSTSSQAEFFTPEKINVRPGTTNYGNEYEAKVTLVLALRCLFQEFSHFWLATNLKGFAALDDVIMFVQRNETDEGVTYIMQLKHQNNPKSILETGLLAAEGDFSLKKYSKCYDELKSKSHDKEQTTGLIERLRQGKMLFIIFTNKRVYDNVNFLHPLDESPEDVMNEDESLLEVIGSKENAFKIDYETLATEPDVNIEFLKKLFLFTNQPHGKNMNQEIKNIIKDNVPYLPLSDMNLTDIVQKFVEYIDDWFKGHLGGHYPLTKKDISKKLTELLLLPYMVHLSEPIDHTDQRNENIQENIEENEEENIWYHLTQNKDVTVIDEADEVVQQYLISATYDIIGYRNILSAITRINRQLLRVVSNSQNMSQNEKYELLWKTRKVPLLLQVCDEQAVQQVQEILKRFPKVFRVIILNKTKIPLQRVQGLKSFINLTDLSSQHQKLIFKRNIKFQGKMLSIAEINFNKKEFLKSLKVKDIVHILLGQFNIGGEFEKLPDFFVETSVTRNIFNIALLKEVAQDILVVKCKSLENFERLLIEKLGINNNKIIHWERVSRNNLEGKMIIVDFNQNLQEVVDFCLTLKKTVHFLVWHRETNLELIKSNNINEYLKTFEKTPAESVFAKELLQNFCQNNQTLLISANPGMGKSVLMNYFALNIPTHLWVLKINLAKHKDQYKHWETQNFNSQQLYFESFYKEVLKEQETTNSEIFNIVFEQFLKSKKVVWLFDAYDEVPVNRQNGAKQLIKFINQSGYYTCVTTRPVLEHELQLALNTFAVTLNMFTINEQTGFLRNYFANIGNVSLSDNRVISFVTELLEATKLNLNDEDNRFTGIPLQTTLLAEVFKDDFKNYLVAGIFKNQHFDLIYLYEHFIKEKTKIAFKKVESVSEVMIDQYKTCRSFYALRHLFAEQDLKELKIDDQLQVIKKMFQHTMQLIQKDGIVVTDSHSNVTFVHQTYAEFLVANWLAQNINTSYKDIVRKLIKKTFHPSFFVVRNMFDRILAKNCPLHTAIINRQMVKVKELIASNEYAFDTADDGGRTILHLIAAWGLRHPDSFIRLYDRERTNDFMMITLNRIPNNKLTHVEDLFNYTPLDYAILSRSLHIADRLSLIIKNPCCFSNLTEEEADSVLKYVKKYYSLPLYIVILKCLIRTGQNENEAIRAENLANVNTPDENGRCALHWASYLGHLDIISLLLSNGATVDTTDCHNLTPLHYALLSSSSNQADIVSLLTETTKRSRPPALDIPTEKSNTIMPLHLAASLGQIHVLPSLLLDIVDINAKGWNGMTPLILAVLTNNVDSVNLLLTTGADVEAKDSRNRTPLHVAAEEGHHSVVTVLLDHDANTNAIDYRNRTPLRVAAEEGHDNVVSVLLTYRANVKAIYSHERTLLHVAAQKGYSNVVKVLLSHGADIKAVDSHKRTPLHIAAQKGYSDVVTVLLDHSADIKAVDSDDRTPLHVAAQKGYSNVVDVLLNHSADIKAVDSHNRTSLDVAVQKGHYNVASVLLTHGADIKAVDCHNRTFLHLAAQKGYYNVVTVLLTHGADVEVVDSDSKTPLHVAAQKGYSNVVTVLLNRGADMNAVDSHNKTPVHLAARGNHLDVVILLLDQGANINAIDSDNKTPLHLAVQEGHEDVATLLLTRDADIKAIDFHNKTALHVAVQKGHCNLVTILLSHGADIKAVDCDNRTPLHFASREGLHDIVTVLITHGADVGAIDSDNKTPLHFASQEGHHDVVTILLSHGADTQVVDSDNKTVLDLATMSGDSLLTSILLRNGTEI